MMGYHGSLSLIKGHTVSPGQRRVVKMKGIATARLREGISGACGVRSSGVGLMDCGLHRARRTW